MAKAGAEVIAFAGWQIHPNRLGDALFEFEQHRGQGQGGFVLQVEIGRNSCSTEVLPMRRCP